MELQVIEDYINSKLLENEEYVRITFYDLRVKQYNYPKNFDEINKEYEMYMISNQRNL